MEKPKKSIIDKNFEINRRISESEKETGILFDKNIDNSNSPSCAFVVNEGDKTSIFRIIYRIL